MTTHVRAITVKSLFTPAARTTSTDGSAVDLQGLANIGKREFKAFVDVGTALGTTPSVTVKIQESDTTTAGDFTDITGATFTAFTTGTNEAIHFQTQKRYVRAVATYTANTTSSTFSASVMGGARYV